MDNDLSEGQLLLETTPLWKSSNPYVIKLLEEYISEVLEGLESIEFLDDVERRLNFISLYDIEDPR